MTNAELIAEARDALGRVNTNAFDHDLLFQYRGGVLGRELTLIVRDIADALEAAEARVKELEAGEISALREARAETWDEAISAVFAWWSAPPEQRPAGIVNPYGIGLPVESEGE